MKKRTVRHHSDEFKQEAVRQAIESGKPKSSIARELNVSVSLLYDWINKYDKAKFKGITPKELKAENDELRRLKAENKELKTENAILKKAAAYFAKEQL